MRVVQLIRGGSDAQGTFGKLYAAGFVRYTGELPWRENAAERSCIPIGRYECRWTPSPRFRHNTYRLFGVPGRSGVLVHSANFMGDASLGWRCQLAGCVALGERLGLMDGQRAILISAPAVRQFETLMQHKPFILEITYADAARNAG